MLEKVKIIFKSTKTAEITERRQVFEQDFTTGAAHV